MNNDKKQQGIVSIVVTMILMVVLTLVVVSFAKISRNESRNALDRQLSTQAFYAAESGINVARSKLEATIATAPESPLLSASYMTKCAGDGSFSQKFDVGGTEVGPNSSFTCLFVNPTPASLVYSKTNDPVVFPFNPTNGSTGLKITWNKGDNGTYVSGDCFATTETNPTKDSPGVNHNCIAPVLRVEIANLSSGVTKVFFLYPKGLITGSLSFSASQTGAKSKADCSGTNCTYTINDVTSGSYVRLKGIYGPIAATVESSPVSNLTGAQAIIDATGKAADVERRLQVRIPISGLATNLPMYAIEATDKVCKQFAIWGGADGATDSGNCWGGGAPN